MNNNKINNQITIQLSTLPKVDSAGYFEVTKPWLHRYRQVPFHTLIYVTHGVLSLQENGQRYTVPKGNVFFFKANQVQSAYNHILPGSKWYWINFIPMAITDDAIVLPKFMPVKQDFYLREHLQAITSLFESGGSYSTHEMNAHLYQTFIFLCQSIDSQQNNTKESGVAKRIIACLENQLSTGFNSQDIADSLGMNYSYLSRCFRSETGSTIKHYYLSLRINEAIILMSTTTLNISQISDQLSFSNPYYFSRVFKQITGSSPSNYRQKVH